MSYSFKRCHPRKKLLSSRHCPNYSPPSLQLFHFFGTRKCVSLRCLNWVKMIISKEEIGDGSLRMSLMVNLAPPPKIDYVGVAGVPPNLGNPKWTFFFLAGFPNMAYLWIRFWCQLGHFQGPFQNKHDEAHNNQHLVKYSNLFLKTQQPSYLSGVVHSACFSESWNFPQFNNSDPMLCHLSWTYSKEGQMGLTKNNNPETPNLAIPT